MPCLADELLGVFEHVAVEVEGGAVRIGRKEFPGVVAEFAVHFAGGRLGARRE